MSCQGAVYLFAAGLLLGVVLGIAFRDEILEGLKAIQ